MKQVKIKLPLRTLALAGGLFLSATAFAQSGAVKGQVKDATGEPVMGATISANGKTVGITELWCGQEDRPHRFRHSSHA